MCNQLNVPQTQDEPIFPNKVLSKFLNGDKGNTSSGLVFAIQDGDVAANLGYQGQGQNSKWGRCKSGGANNDVIRPAPVHKTID